MHEHMSVTGAPVHECTVDMQIQASFTTTVPIENSSLPVIMNVIVAFLICEIISQRQPVKMGTSEYTTCFGQG